MEGIDKIAEIFESIEWIFDLFDEKYKIEFGGAFSEGLENDIRYDHTNNYYENNITENSNYSEQKIEKTIENIFGTGESIFNGDMVENNYGGSGYYDSFNEVLNIIDNGANEKNIENKNADEIRNFIGDIFEKNIELLNDGEVYFSRYSDDEAKMFRQLRNTKNVGFWEKCFYGNIEKIANSINGEYAKHDDIYNRIYNGKLIEKSFPYRWFEGKENIFNDHEISHNQSIYKYNNEKNIFDYDAMNLCENGIENLFEYIGRNLYESGGGDFFKFVEKNLYENDIRNIEHIERELHENGETNLFEKAGKKLYEFSGGNTENIETNLYENAVRNLYENDSRNLFDYKDTTVIFNQTGDVANGDHNLYLAKLYGGQKRTDDTTGLETEKRELIENERNYEKDHEKNINENAADYEEIWNYICERLQSEIDRSMSEVVI